MRKKGEGSIYRETASGLWCVAVVVDGQRRVIRSKRQDVLLDKLRTLQHQAARGLPTPSENLTVATFFDEWLGSKRGTLKPQTWEAYESKVRLHIVPILGRVRLMKLDRQHIQHLYDVKLQQGLSEQSIHHLDAVLHKALADGMRWGRVLRNVAELVDPPRIPRHEMRALSAHEAATFLEEARGDRLEAVYVLAIGTGMRRGELLALHWRDVDLDQGFVSVNWTLSRTKAAGIRCDEPKTRKSRRRIDLEGDCIRALRDHLGRQRAERLVAGAVWENNDLVFANELGRLIEPSNFTARSFLPIRRRAGFPQLRFHDLRHTAGTLMLEAGVDIKRVSERLGHSTINVTADRYLHVTPAMDRSAAEAVGQLLRVARAGLPASSP